MSMKTFLLVGFLGAALQLTNGRIAADEVGDDLASIRGVGPGGKGAGAARQARDRLAKGGVEILPRLLGAMNVDNPLAANWYRSAYEQLVREELGKSNPRLPVELLRAHVRSPENHGRVRRLVLDLVNRVDSGFGSRLIPTLLDDPEFRDDAIAETFKRGDAAKAQGDADLAERLYSEAFRHARDAAT